MNSQAIIYGKQVDFQLASSKQAMLLQVLLRYSELKIEDLAELLSLPLVRLIQVMKGDRYLEQEEAELLIDCFIIFCGG